MSELNITGPTYLYTSGIHKKGNKSSTKRKEKYCTGKEGNKSEDIIRISYDFQHTTTLIDQISDCISWGLVETKVSMPQYLRD